MSDSTVALNEIPRPDAVRARLAETLRVARLLKSQLRIAENRSDRRSDVRM
jgi:hypothetical protein